MFVEVCAHAEAVHTVRVLEESCMAWISLNIAPATALPAAWYQVKRLVHCNLIVHLLVLSLVICSSLCLGVGLRADTRCSRL